MEFVKIWHTQTGTAPSEGIVWRLQALAEGDLKGFHRPVGANQG